MKTQPEIYFDFGELGRPGWHAVSALELEIIWQGAQPMIAAALADPRRELATLRMIQHQQQTLLREALTQEVSPFWVTRALLIAALQGSLLGQLPDYRYDLD
jgi:hypothetical protein